MQVLGKELSFYDVPVDFLEQPTERIIYERGRGTRWARYDFEERQWRSVRYRVVEQSLYFATPSLATFEQQRAFLLDNLGTIHKSGRIREGLTIVADAGISIAWRQLDMALRVEEAILSSPHPYLACAHIRNGFAAALLAVSEPLEEDEGLPPVWFLWVTRRNRMEDVSLVEPEFRRRTQWQHLLADD